MTVIVSEEEFIADVRAWTGRIADWTRRQKVLRDERNALENELATTASKVVLGLIATGTPRHQAEERVEQLIEQACRA